MVGPPRLHEELGANGVEVTIWERAQGDSARNAAIWKRGQQQRVAFAPALEVKSEPLAVSGRRCFPSGSSRGRPTIRRRNLEFEM